MVDLLSGAPVYGSPENKKGPFSMYGNPYTQNDPSGFVIRLLGSISCSEVDLTHVTSFFCGNKKRGRFACTGQYIQNDLLIFVD